MTSGPASPGAPHLDGEQMSTFVDGLGSAAEVAHAESCPECAARAEIWRQARRWVATAPDPPSTDRQDTAIRAALAVFDEQREQGEQSPVVLSTGADRSRVRLSPRTVAAVAAALLVVSGLAVTLSRSSHHHHSPAVASGTRASPTAPVVNGPASSSEPSSASAGASGAGAGSLGQYPNLASLLPVLRSRVSALGVGRSAVPAEPSAAPRCQSSASAATGVPLSTPPVFDAALTYAGTPAVVYVYRAPASNVAVVLGQASCRLLGQSSF